LTFAARAGISGGTSLALSEGFAVMLEALVLNCVWEIPMGRALTGSLLANMTSWWLGTWIVSWFWA